MTLEALLLFGNMFTVFNFDHHVHIGTCSLMFMYNIAQ